MATPKGIPAVSTPKNPHTSTPSRLIASPRPNTGTFGSKTLAYKSPAVKTPSSIHGHSHRVSISSHPTLTPLAAPAIHDELLNLNSPAAALIASIGNSALTPMVTGQDGLGITSGITPHAVREAPLQVSSPETEKLYRLEQVAGLLKSKIAGYGITREDVQTIAQIQGFTILWDEDNLTIAGNCVDLEITFDAVERDRVSDVQLRLNLEGSEEPQLQKEASEVLKSHLIISTAPILVGVWKSLRDFTSDLEYLSKLDYIDSSVNCFELMISLFDSFRKIWDEEKKRSPERSVVDHICQSNVGMPDMNANARLGVTTRFWIDKQNALTVTSDSERDESELNNSWIASLSCEKGSPGMNADRVWLESEPLRNTMSTEDVFQDDHMDQPNWSVPNLNKAIAQQQKDANEMLLDESDNNLPDTIDLIFSCRLDREVLIPVNILNELNNVYPMILLDQTKAVTYQQVLVNEAKSMVSQEWNPNLRWSKSFSIFDKEGVANLKTHSYALFAHGVPWSYPLTELKFAHPKQFADAIPVLRQYALLWTILHNTLAGGTQIEGPKSHDVAEQSAARGGKRPAVTRRSNKTTAESQLESILSLKRSDQVASRIDLSLDFLSEAPKAKLEALVPVPSNPSHKSSVRFMKISMEIRRHGIVEVSAIEGPQFKDEEKTKRKATRVLSLSEDISVLVEWLLGEVYALG